MTGLGIFFMWVAAAVLWGLVDHFIYRMDQRWYAKWRKTQARAALRRSG